MFGGTDDFAELAQSGSQATAVPFEGGYRNADFPPGMVEMQSTTLDDPEALPPHRHIQAAERLRWVERAHELPSVSRFPEPAQAACTD